MLHWLQRERYKKKRRKRLFIRMHMCVYKRDRTVPRTWLLGAPELSHRDRILIEKSTVVTLHQLPSLSTSLHLTVLLCALALIYLLLFQALSIIFIFDSCTLQILISHNPCFPSWSIYFQ